MALNIKTSPRQSEGKQQALLEAEREITVRLNINIPENLHKALKLQAIHEGHGVTMTQLIVKACQTYLRKYSNE